MTVLSSVDLQSGTSSFLRKHHAKQTPFLPIISFSLLNGTSAFQSLVLMLQWQWWFSVQQQLRSWQFSGRAPLEEGETLGGWDSQPVLESASVPGIGFRKYLGSLRNVNLWDYFNLSSPTYGIKTHFVEWNWNPEGPPMLHLTSSMEISSPDSYGSEASLLQAKMQTLSYRQGCDGTMRCLLVFDQRSARRFASCLL